MPPSQLKRLKSSLREQGITGPQKSKKQKKVASKDSRQRIEKQAALQGIRDSFNPFELKAPSRPAKFQSVSHKIANQNGRSYKEVLHRPGVTRSLGEEARKATLLPEIQRRNKVGGLVDRRIGENDPTMTPEERAVQRFAREKQRKKGGALFDLEGSDDEGLGGLTHLGKSLELDGQDDYNDAVSAGSESDAGDDELMKRKRRRSSMPNEENEEDEEETEGQPERKKSKNEVMKEVMAKSKLYKYERQKVKEDDDDLREQLDSGLQEMLSLLQGQKRPALPTPPEEDKRSGSNDFGINPDRQALLDGTDRDRADKEYEKRLRELAREQRAAPAEPSKTAEEKAKQEAERLQKLEESRLRRMRGEEVSEDEEESREKPAGPDEDAVPDDEDDLPDDAAEFGFTSSAAQPKQAKEQLVLDDEDEFALDEDLVADSSEIDVSGDSEDEEGSDVEGSAEQEQDDEEDEFVKGILGPDLATGANAAATEKPSGTGLAYTYPCPRSHAELLDVLKAVPVTELPTVIQRIRALYHPSLSSLNKEAMGDFSSTLVDHISYMADVKQPLSVIETLIRHIHSLSRTYPETIANAFRRHLQGFGERGTPTGGDLVLLTAIGSIYPTSDHFHQVVTPAITLMAKWLALHLPHDDKDHQTGAFLVALCLKYQVLSKRYVPETVRWTLKALATKSSHQAVHMANLNTMADLWKDKSAFVEIFSPFLTPLHRAGAKKAVQHLNIQIGQARLRRRPLELHHHKPLPIRTSIPKFEESYNPDKHYDPDKERSESKKLQKEYKREKKGALRELRKDAAFVARHQLRDKKEKDAEHVRRERRLIAEIQGEEGHEKREYERVKRMRKGAR